MLRRIIALTFAVLALAAVPAGAQYFGRNKVQYRDLDFWVLETQHFEIYYYPAEYDAVVEAARLAERWYVRLSRVLDHTFRKRQPIVFYASHAHFTQTTVVPGFLDEGVGGITEHQRGRVALPFAAGLGETDHVLGHELVHVFQRDILRRNSRSIATMPLWFVEGMAEYLSVGRIDPNTAMWLRDAAEQNRLPRIDQLGDPQWFPYRYGQALWAYLTGRFGEDVVARCLKSKASGGAIGRLVAVSGMDVKSLSDDWRASIRHTGSLRTGEGLASVTRSSQEDAPHPSRAIVTSEQGGGHFNVGPALSPDGRDVVFLSERDQYSIDVYLADAATGAIRRTLIESAIDPHFDSLQFIESAGAWDPTGRRFVLAALSRGQPVLTILDMPSGAVEREIRLGQLDQIFNPTWSPDARQLAFSALKGGLSDLYVIDLDTGALRGLTNDPFGDLQPTWSPDGKTIAFATDRFSSSMATLSFGNYRLGAIDIDSRAVRELPGVPGGKNIDPHWSADGASLYFIADAGHVSNLYRMEVATGELFQVTDVSTGVSGVTALSPALSVAKDTNRLAFSVYRHGAYEIRAIDASSGTPIVPAAPVAAPAATATTVADVSPQTSAALSSTLGLLDGREFAVKPYRRGLSFDGIAQPYLSAGGGSGTARYIRAGVSLSFSDMLSEQRLQTALQVGTSVNDFLTQTAYVNLRSRWNWALVGGQVPWFTSGAQSTSFVPSADDTTTIMRQQNVFRQVHRQLSGVVIYPFSGAKRLELSAGAQAISFDRETTTTTYSGVSGRLMNESTNTATAAPSALLVESGAALVYDTAIFGPTSPILGERYRFAVTPTIGSLTFATITADYRKYVMPVRPFTVATRVMHIGRYGPGATDQRLLPLVWTLRDVVRGYGDTGQSRSANYLGATSLLVGNVELRFPLLSIFAKPQRAGLPLEGLVFSDLGAFRTHASVPARTLAVWNGLASTGAGVRLNAAGLVFEFDAARRVARAHTELSGWTFAFNFRPGF